MSGRTSSAGGCLDWKGVLGLVISAGLLWYAFRDVDLAEVWAHVREADLGLLALAGAVATALFPLRALRWRPLLQPAYPETRFRPRFAATSVGFMANNLLPARVGEFARAYALSRLEPIRLSASLGSLVVERLFDGLVIVGFLLASMAWPGFPDVTGRDFGSVATWAGAAFLVGFVVLLAMAARPDRSLRLFEVTLGRVLPDRWSGRLTRVLHAFLEGLGAIRDWRLVLRVAAWSLVLWIVGALSMWIGLLAFGIHVPFVAAIFLQSVIGLAVALPSAPGFFGVFEAAARVALVEVWGVASSPALAFAVGFHLAGFIPITVIGLYYLWRLGLSWGEVEHSEEAVEAAVAEQDADGPADAR